MFATDTPLAFNTGPNSKRWESRINPHETFLPPQVPSYWPRACLHSSPGAGRASRWSPRRPDQLHKNSGLQGLHPHKCRTLASADILAPRKRWDLSWASKHEEITSKLHSGLAPPRAAQQRYSGAGPTTSGSPATSHRVSPPRARASSSPAQLPAPPPAESGVVSPR
jgi:hypothetical protein